MPEYWNQLWLTNRAVADAYGLTPEDFEYILSTFRVFARKRPDFLAYLQQRVKEWKSGTRPIEPLVKPYQVTSRQEIRLSADSHKKYGKESPEKK